MYCSSELKSNPRGEWALNTFPWTGLSSPNYCSTPELAGNLSDDLGSMGDLEISARDLPMQISSKAWPFTSQKNFESKGPFNEQLSGVSRFCDCFAHFKIQFQQSDRLIGISIRESWWTGPVTMYNLIWQVIPLFRIWRNSRANVTREREPGIKNIVVYFLS